MLKKEQKFILFFSKKIKDHLKIYIDADLKNLDGTWCFFCNKKLKKNDKNFQDWYAVNNNTDFLTSVETGEIICIAEPIKVGRSYQLWESKIYHNDKLCAVSKVRLSKIK